MKTNNSKKVTIECVKGLKKFKSLL
jgi:hypothetical protein